MAGRRRLYKATRRRRPLALDSVIHDCQHGDDPGETDRERS